VFFCFVLFFFVWLVGFWFFFGEIKVVEER